ncbi:MAG: gldN [Mucilaginibacter sp.]|jgi:gliding motility associated protien GldN|nr:gldN [Mucilaginibacter sp.]
MKTRFLIIILCLACSASFAQKKKAATKAPVKKTVAAQQPKTTGAPNTALGAGATAQKAVLDTGKKTPAKPFDRPLDGYYKKTNIASAKVTPYANLRESDVTFAKRVWREIDLREKMNQYLLSPKQRLIDVLMAAIDAGELTAYDPTASKEDPNGDSFSKPMTGAQARSKMSDSSVVDKFDKDGNKIGSEVRAGEFNPDSVVKFRIKEDWVFDKQRSIFEPRIIGIAPLIKPKAAGLDLDYQPAFWLYFPEARPILATKEAVSRNNDATGLSFDDIFVKRLFSSYIVKQSNDKDERIRDYAQGIDKLYEAERIKKTLADYELNLWKYSE